MRSSIGLLCSLAFLTAACSAVTDEEHLSTEAADTISRVKPTSFEQFEAQTYRESGTGIYIVDGDTPIVGKDALRAFYEELLASTSPRTHGLTVSNKNGRDVVWDATTRQHLTYCVSVGFGARYGSVVTAMDRATREWEKSANVKFEHIPSADASCSAANNNVLFDVSSVSGQPYLARAFFPDTARAARNVMIDATSFSTTRYSLTGILRHELGHTIGFRHEHTRPEAGICFEDKNWRPLARYDAASVMHYPQCHGSNTGDLALTMLDRSGARGVYGVGTGRTRHDGDFDGDGRADVSIFRPREGKWYIARSSDGGRTDSFGEAGDQAVQGDYDGDGLADLGVFRASTGTWYIKLSAGGSETKSFGQSGDIAQPNDYDGDGKMDIALWRPSIGVWYILQSTDGPLVVSFGQAGDVPVSADYDGDWKVDAAVFRPSEGKWYLNQSSRGGEIVTFGAVGDVAVPGDYDGDGKTDVGVFRPSEGKWYLRRSSAGGAIVDWGQRGDFMVPSDYDGDGTTDIAVFRASTGTWYISPSTDPQYQMTFGQFGDIPAASVIHIQ